MAKRWRIRAARVSSVAVPGPTWRSLLRPCSLSIEREFDALAATYDGNRLAAWYQAHGGEILKLIHCNSEGTVVDIGCGTGWLLRQMVAKCPGREGIGIDVSTRMIAEARRKALEVGATNLNFVRADWEGSADTWKPELRGRTVDTVVCASSFHYFSNPRDAVARIHQTLAPGGRFFLMERAKDGSSLTLIWDVLHKLVLKDHARFYRTRDLVSLLGEVGFHNVRVRHEIRRLLWKGKLFTSVVLITADKDALSATPP